MKQVSCYTIHLSVYINYQHILVTDTANKTYIIYLIPFILKMIINCYGRNIYVFSYIAAGYKNYSTFYGNDSCLYLHWFR